MKVYDKIPNKMNTLGRLIHM